jgi:hypothetical protein
VCRRGCQEGSTTLATTGLGAAVSTTNAPSSLPSPARRTGLAAGTRPQPLAPHLHLISSHAPEARLIAVPQRLIIKLGARRGGGPGAPSGGTGIRPRQQLRDPRGCARTRMHAVAGGRRCRHAESGALRLELGAHPAVAAPPTGALDGAELSQILCRAAAHLGLQRRPGLVLSARPRGLALGGLAWGGGRGGAARIRWGAGETDHWAGGRGAALGGRPPHAPLAFSVALGQTVGPAARAVRHYVGRAGGHGCWRAHGARGGHGGRARFAANKGPVAARHATRRVRRSCSL